MCWLAFELVFLYLTVIETKNLSLEETAAIFDGDQALVQITGRATNGLTSSEPIEDRENLDRKVSLPSSREELGA